MIFHVPLNLSVHSLHLHVRLLESPKAKPLGLCPNSEPGGWWCWPWCWVETAWDSDRHISVSHYLLPDSSILNFLQIPINIPMTYIREIEKSTLKFIWKHKRLWIAKTTLYWAKEQLWMHHNIQLQTILQSHSNKISMVLAQKQMNTSGTE
jgi:hypothetical protein